MKINKGYERVCYLLIFSLITLGLSQVRNNIYIGIGLISQAVIIFGFMEIIEKGVSK